jgi:purine-binding chemotaxis protein CheW
MRQPLNADADRRTGLSPVTFRLGQQIYAVPIDPVVQIVEMVAVTSIPQVDHAIEGVINYHGVTVPVVDLRRHLGLPCDPPGLDVHIMIVTLGERMVGLIVDQVIQVLDLLEAQIAGVEDILPEGLGDVPILDGVIHTPEGTVILLDVDRLFLPRQAQALARAVDALAVDAAPEAEQETPASVLTLEVGRP